jgi:TPR repeat protein
MDLDLLLESAHRGNADSQFKVAEAFRIGEHVRKSEAQALAWYRRAAEQGHVDAQNNLASMHLNGLGTKANADEAMRWYEKAAEAGHAVAQFNLALRYLHGSGVAQNDDEAVRWLAAAAQQGHTEAICELGTLCRFGRGMKQDLAKAAELHVIAAMDGDSVAVGNLSDYYPEIERVALGGSALAALCLAKMYDKGLARDKDEAKALAWLRWGKEHCQHDADEDVREELAEMDAFYSMFVTDATTRRVKELLVTMKQSRTAGTGNETHV